MARTKHITTVANTVATVDFTYDSGQVAIFNYEGDETVYVRADGIDPLVAGDDSFAVPAGARRVIDVTTDGPTDVRVISAGINQVEVEAA